MIADQVGVYVGVAGRRVAKRGGDVIMVVAR